MPQAGASAATVREDTIAPRMTRADHGGDCERDDAIAPSCHDSTRKEPFRGEPFSLQEAGADPRSTSTSFGHSPTA